MNYDLKSLNKQPHLSIPTGDIRISPYNIEQLLDVKIHQKINEHGTLYFRGILADTSKGSYPETSVEGTNVILSAVDASGEEYVLFQGVVNDVKVQMANELRYIEVCAVSYTCLMDIAEKSRTFQDKRKSYTDLVTQVTDGYAEADVIDTASKGKQTNKFIVQHKETDWAFLKRLASHFNTGLICDVRFNAPRYFFGIPEGSVLVLDDNCNYNLKKDMQSFNQLSKNGVSGLSEADFICYEVETSYIARVGDAVTFKQKQLYVSEITSVAEKGLFISRISIMPRNGLSQLYQPNRNIVGASFGGHILESKNDTVKVSLDIDRGHDPGKPCFFSYSTIYSSQDGSGWYCMPEIGDTVRIYFPDGEDNHAYAISSVHEQVDQDMLQQSQQGSKSGNGQGGGGMRESGGAGGYSGQRDDPTVKSLTYGDKEIRLTPEGVYIIMENSMIMMTDEGITIMSENDISFKSDKSIYLCAETDVSIVGNSSVEIKCGETTGVMIVDNVQVIGQEVKAN